MDQKSRDLEKSEGGLGFTVHARIWIWARRGTEAEAAPAAELELAGAAGCAGGEEVAGGGGAGKEAAEGRGSRGGERPGGEVPAAAATSG